MTRITIISPDDTIVLRDDYRWKHHIWAIKKNGITGLFGTPAVRETPTDRPQTDGAYWPSRLTQKPRSISLDCVIRGLSGVDAAQARDRINALAGKELTIVEHTASGTRSLKGFLAADPEPMMRWHEQGFEFGLVISCPDPLKYGEPVTFVASGGVCRVTNSGTASTWPTVSVSGRVTSLRLTMGDGEVRWEGDAEDLELDFRDMIPSSGTVTKDLAFRIPPGTSTVTVRADAGSTVSMTVRPAWR